MENKGTKDASAETAPTSEPQTQAEPSELPPPEGENEADLDHLPEIEDTEDEMIAKPPRIKDLLTSPDSPSRFMTLLSIMFGGLSLLCIILLTYVIITHKRAKKHDALDAEHQKVFVDPIISESLGHFQIVLKAEPNQPHDFNLRVDIVVQCTTQEACTSLKNNMIEARDVVNPILSSVTRDEFLTLQGKNRIRRRIAEQLSGMVHDGKIDEAQFTDLTIETGK